MTHDVLRKRSSQGGCQSGVSGAKSRNKAFNTYRVSVKSSCLNSILDARRNIRFSLVAQLVERRFEHLKIAGSKPREGDIPQMEIHHRPCRHADMRTASACKYGRNSSRTN